ESRPTSAPRAPLPRLLSLRVPLKDLPLTPRLKESVDHFVRTGSRRQDAEENLKLQYYFGGWEIGFLPEPDGFVVVALVHPSMCRGGDVLGQLTPQERQRVVFPYRSRVDGEDEPLPPPAYVL